MSERPAIVGMSIEAFRGVSERIDLDLDAAVVLVIGPNGTGKTTVFDALQWLLIGSLDRLKPYRMRTNTEHIVSRYRLPGPAVVSADFVINGEAVSARRSGTYESSLLELTEAGGSPIRGSAAEGRLREIFVSGPALELEDILFSSTVLQQDVMRAVLEAKPHERYEHLVKMLGLEVLVEFSNATRERLAERRQVVRDAKEREATLRREAEVLQSEIARLENQQETAPSILQARNELEFAVAAASGSIRLISEQPLELSELSPLARELSNSARRLRELLGERQVSLATLRDSKDQQQLIQELREHLAFLEQRRESLRGEAERLSQEEQTERARVQTLTQLAALAAPLLTDICPVCLQSIDHDAVAERLHFQGNEAEGLLAVRKRLADNVRSTITAESELQRARQHLEAIQLTQERLNIAVARLGEIDEELDNVDSPSRTFRFERIAVEVGPSGYTELLASIEAILGPAANLAHALTLSGAREDLEQRRGRRYQIQQELENISEQVAESARREAEARTLNDASQAGAIAVTERRFASLRPLVGDIYRRLDPHPTFTELDFEQETFRGRGTTSPVVRDELQRMSVDPLLVFSSSQINSVALAYFLALGLAAGDRALPFLAMDDPIQSMDDINVLGFADVCRLIRTKRQLLISTHDRRFASLLERKLAPRGRGRKSTHCRIRRMEP